jgi:hypothetical protein
MDPKGNTRATVTDSKGTPNVFLGCDSYRIVTRWFGQVVKVIGFNGAFEETVGVYFRPIAASVGMADTEQVEFVKKRKEEARAASL